MKEFFRGLRSFATAHRIISKHKLWPYILTPALASLLISPFVMYAFYEYFGQFARYVNDRWLPSYLQSGIAEVIVTVLFWIVGLILFFVSIRSLLMVIFSPLLGVLSERVEALTTNATVSPFSAKQFTKDIFRSLILNSIALAAFIVVLAFAWLLIFIPIVGLAISPILAFLVESYFAGVGFIDPSLERHKYGIRQSFAYSWEHRMRVAGVGAGFSILMFIPIFGWFLAPPYGVVAATLSYMEVERPQPGQLKSK